MRSTTPAATWSRSCGRATPKASMPWSTCTATPISSLAMAKPCVLTASSSPLADPALQRLHVVRGSLLGDEGVEPEPATDDHLLGDLLGRADPEGVVVFHLAHRRAVVRHLRLPGAARLGLRGANERLACAGAL